jgi:anaerobic selenocysteine-containing dehydrogenase
MAADSEERIVKTVCSTCYCGCGVLAYVKDGKVVKLEGDPDHPNNRGELCPKGLSAIELLYHPDRLNYPMKRKGKRGEGKWQRISWEEAIETISSRLNGVRAENGPQAISVAVGAGLYSNLGMISHFCYAVGTPNMLSSGYICFMPSAVAARATIGYPAALFAEEVVSDEALNSKCILLWGANPRNTCPYPLGEGIFKVKERGTKLIVVDPRPTDYTRIADFWLKIRPATDDALALGMMNVIINETLYDKKFVEEWTYGFEELKQHVKRYSPDKVSQICWVPEEDIKGAARLFAKTRPSCVCQRVPLDQSCNAVQTSRAIIILNAICGNLDLKGGNPLPTKGDVINDVALWSQLDKLPHEILEKRIGAKQIPLLSGPDAFCGFVHPSLWTNAVLTEKPYQIKALITSARNQMLGDQDSRSFEKAFNKLDFSVTMDLFMTPTAELSDIVLPAASWLERDGIRGHAGYPFVIPIQHRVVEPLHERWDDNLFFIELAREMGLGIPWQTIDAYYDFRLAERGVTLEELNGTNFLTMAKQYDRHNKGDFIFNTPSKKVELFSTFLEGFGYDPLPDYVPPPETTSEFPLILMGGKKKLEYVHSAGRQIPMLRERDPAPTIEMDPTTAQETGTSNGDWVWVETIYFGNQQRARFKAKVIDDFPPQIVAVEHGWWFPEIRDREHGCFKSNVNLLIPGDVYDPIYGSTNIRSIPCRIYKA